ncbi:hypothetical protein F383_23835 [Gossypium arboreum]|uniref:Uncharacterized protein n=1 Tax=Gossypium arboreum TaxID=29729 RepID=A0A0B0MMR8_GOSAR|nr:hypothetical protein F383_23835 [Gossypium arboreum]
MSLEVIVVIVFWVLVSTFYQWLSFSACAAITRQLV